MVFAMNWTHPYAGLGCLAGDGMLLEGTGCELVELTNFGPLYVGNADANTVYSPTAKNMYRFISTRGSLNDIRFVNVGTARELQATKNKGLTAAKIVAPRIGPSAIPALPTRPKSNVVIPQSPGVVSTRAHVRLGKRFVKTLD